MSATKGKPTPKSKKPKTAAKTAAPKAKAVGKKNAKKSTPTTKGVVKDKIVTPKKKSNKRAVSRKTVSKKPQITKSKRAPKKTQTDEPNVAQKRVDTSGAATSKTRREVVLPTRMSIRAREKVLVLADALEVDFYPAAMAIARAGGLCFVLVGGVYSLSLVSADFAHTSICDSGSCRAELISSTPVVTDQTVSKSSFEVLTPVPTVLTGTQDVTMEIENSKSQSALATYNSQDGTKKSKSIPITNLPNSKYKLVLDPAVYDPNLYQLQVHVHYNDSDTFTTYTIGSFVVEPDSAFTDDLVLDLDVVETKSEDKTVDTSPVESVEEDVLRASATYTLAPVMSPSERKVVNREDGDSLATTTDKVEILRITTASAPEPVELSSEEPFVISAPRQVSGVVRVSIGTTESLETIEFYIRPLQGLRSQLVGNTAPGDTSFALNTMNLPNGLYELYATAVGPAGTSQSIQIIVNVANTPEVADRSSADVTGAEREILQVTTILPEFMDTDSEVSEGGGLSIDQSIGERADVKLSTKGGELDRLFRALASAEQAGDEALIRKANAAITSFQAELVTEALENERDRFVVRELEVALSDRLNDLSNRVRTFEAVRRERTEASSATDTDQDGISDIDERVLYQTDPLLPDTDNDGFTDGAEIASGFDPLNTASEAAIIYESPKDTVGVVTTDKLIVADVTPDILLGEADTPAVVQTVVRGQALPNSFVTLFVFSTPTIVTVRTDDDGVFEYTFTKELEDGEHQVFVALTDNTGDIVAQSAPFTFVKEAQAFTPVSAQTALNTLQSPPATNDSSSTFGIALGMSVLALGILLIMLGVGLRGVKPDIVAEVEAT